MVVAWKQKTFCGYHGWVDEAKVYDKDTAEHSTSKSSDYPATQRNMESLIKNQIKIFIWSA